MAIFGAYTATLGFLAMRGDRYQYSAAFNHMYSDIFEQVMTMIIVGVLCLIVGIILVYVSKNKKIKGDS